MALDRRWLVLDAIRRGLRTPLSEMTQQEVEEHRRSRVPQVPVGQELLDRLGRWLFGTPRPSVAIRTDSLQGADGELPARIYRPPELPDDAPLILYLHGGGWMLGSPRQYDWICSCLAEDVGALVVSVDYGKAPEAPAPAAYEDATAAFRWLEEHRTELRATGPVAVAGDSAGGNLAALVAIAARDEGRALGAQVLIYPGTDLTRSFPSVNELTDEPILHREDIDAFVERYLAGGLEADDPRVSPWFVEDVSGVAPALVQTAHHDPLVDEGEAYAARLREVGVEVRLTRYVDVPHGFVSLPGITPAAKQAVAEQVAFLRGHLLT